MITVHVALIVLALIGAFVAGFGACVVLACCMLSGEISQREEASSIGVDNAPG